ncbi:MAG: hypothetical protein WCD70_04675 [Alphaproteobacteria bacterium]
MANFSPHRLAESDIEIATLDWLAGLGWVVAHGPDLAPEEKVPEHASHLLPKLISGDIRIRDAEKFVGAA